MPAEGQQLLQIQWNSFKHSKNLISLMLTINGKNQVLLLQFSLILLENLSSFPLHHCKISLFFFMQHYVFLMFIVIFFYSFINSVPFSLCALNEISVSGTIFSTSVLTFNCAVVLLQCKLFFCTALLFLLLYFNTNVYKFRI